MTKRLLIHSASLALALCLGSTVVFGQKTADSGGNSGNTAGEWSGMLVSSSCNADEAFNESPECFKNVPDAKIALYDDTNRVMYDLKPQKSVNAKLGDIVTVRGTYDGETIHMSSMEQLTIGLPVGKKAPAFSATDQNGHAQTLDTLEGTNGTVLLFFRSADW